MAARALDPELIPPVAGVLRRAWHESGLSVPRIAAEADISAASIRNFLQGWRLNSKNHKPIPSTPPDNFLVRLADVLHIDPSELRAVDRGRAADLLEERLSHSGHTVTAEEAADEETVRARASLTHRLLSAFTTDELIDELAGRTDSRARSLFG